MPPSERERSLSERVDAVASQAKSGDARVAKTASGRLVDRVAEALAVVLLGTIVVLIFLNSLGRYAFASPLVWTEEVVASLIIWLAVAGAFLAVRRRQLITVEVVTIHLPQGLRHGLQVVVQLASALILAYLAWLGWRYLEIFGGDRTPYFGFPKGFYMSALVVGFGAMAVACLLSLGRHRQRR